MGAGQESPLVSSEQRLLPLEGPSAFGGRFTIGAPKAMAKQGKEGETVEGSLGESAGGTWRWALLGGRLSCD